MFLAQFRSILPILGAKNFFSGESGSVTQNFIWISSTMHDYYNAHRRTFPFAAKFPQNIWTMSSYITAPHFELNS